MKILIVGVALLLLTVTLKAPAQTENSDPTDTTFALTIPGGISLGMYEAGANWAIVEALRKLNLEDQLEVHLRAATGASAGAINTIITALRYCEAEGSSSNGSISENLFYRTWDIGLDDLLPRSEGAYTPLALELKSKVTRPVKDSVFSRKIFEEKIDLLRKFARDGQFRDGCEFDIAIVITQSVPDFSLIGSESRAIGSGVQRFVVPVRVLSNSALGIEGSGVHFRNNIEYEEDSSGYRVVRLPETDGRISFDVIGRTILASSAFPFVFGRVELQYCYGSGDSEEVSPRARGQCPPGHFLRRGYFLDGGVFDNAPIGAAIDLIESRPGNTTGAKYIYLDPKNTTADLQVAQSLFDEGDLSSRGQIKFTAPVITTLRSQVLTSTLEEDFRKSSDRTLLVSRRSVPLAGNLLGGFGAFFDESFFRHDYAAGIFDGISNVVDYLCRDFEPANENNRYCENGPVIEHNKLIQEIVGDLNADRLSTAAQCIENDCVNELVIELVRTFTANTPDGIEGNRTCFSARPESWYQSSEFKKQFSVYQVLCNGQHSSFSEFVAELDERRTKPKGFLKKYEWTYGNDFEYVVGGRKGPWALGLAEQAVYRLYQLEEASNGSLEKPLAATWAMFPGSSRYKPEQSDLGKFFTFILPDYLGVDSFQSGFVFSWDKSFTAPRLNCRRLSGIRTLGNMCKNYSIDIGLETHLRRVENESDRFNTTSVFLGLNFDRPDSFLYSSFGFRSKVSSDFAPLLDDFETSDGYMGTEAYFRFFGRKLEISLGIQGSLNSIGQDDVTLRIGIYDFDRFLRL